MKTYDVAVVGEVYVDHIFTGFSAWPQPGEEVFTKEYLQELGGGAAITACALGQLGRRVHLVAVVGNNEMPWITRRLAAFQVEGDALASGEESTGVTVSVSTRGDRSFFTYAGANTHLTGKLDDAHLLGRLIEARHVHFAFPIGAEVAQQLLEELHAAGCTTSLDVGHQPQWLLDPTNRSICARLDYFLPNEHEAQILCGGGVEDYLRFTETNGWRSGVVKLGAQGAAMRTKERIVRVPSPRVEALDTTGAGDAFNAGFNGGVLDGEAGEDCLRRGCLCGGLSTRAVGGLRGLPARTDLERSYEEVYG